MSFFEKSLNTLELPAVLDMLAAQAVGEAAKERALALAPSADRFEVALRLEETSAAKTMMTVRGGPSFSGVKDVRASLARADLGGAPNTRELLDIARVLQCARLVRGYLADDSVGKTCIDSLFHALRANKFLEEKITTSIVGEDEIADGASNELADIRRRMRAAAARAREARTSFTPEKLGLPRTTIMVLAALVSSRRRFTSKGSDAGVSKRARSLAVSPTAWAESICKTAGSSRVFRDFSKKLISFSP